MFEFCSCFVGMLLLKTYLHVRSGLEVVVSSILVISGRSGNRYTRVSGWGGNRCIMGTSMYVELDLRESCLV